MNSASELDRMSALIRREQVRECPSTQHLDAPTLNDHVPQLVDELAAALKARSAETIPEALSEASPPAHGLQRVQEGARLRDLIDRSLATKP